MAGPVVDESQTSPEFGDKKGEDASLDEIRHWVPEFIGLAYMGFDKSLFFLVVENN